MLVWIKNLNCLCIRNGDVWHHWKENYSLKNALKRNGSDKATCLASISNFNSFLKIIWAYKNYIFKNSFPQACLHGLRFLSKIHDYFQIFIRYQSWRFLTLKSGFSMNPGLHSFLSIYYFQACFENQFQSLKY